MTKLLNTLSGEIFKTPPIWLMRQAGRYLPEYREIRKDARNFVELCLTPDLATEITLQPIRRFEFDAAILFSDILMIPHALGQDVNFVKGEGPKLGILPDKLNFKLSELDPVFETVSKVRSELSQDKTLIGFAGSPWTVACYMINGSGSKDFALAKAFAYENAEKFDALMDILVESTSAYLIAQIEAGADMVQLFDSWAGLVPEPIFERAVISPTARIVKKVKAIHPNVFITGFARGAGVYLEKYWRGTGVDCMGIDETVPHFLAKGLQKMVPIQGNLDNAALLAGGQALDKAVDDILESFAGQPYIFNLGHGVIKETPPEHVAQVVQRVRGNT